MKMIQTLGKRCACALALVTLLCIELLAVPSAREYLQDDGKICGNQINFFSDKGKKVAVVRGGFRFEVASRIVSGENGVVWIATHGKTQHARHDVTIYVEGNAHVEDIDSSTTDSMMLIRLHLQGSITADGSGLSAKPLLNSPLYRKALATLKQDQQMLKAVQAKAERQGKPLKEDPIVVRKSQPKKKPAEPKEEKDPTASTKLENVADKTSSGNGDMQVSEELVSLTGNKPKKTQGSEVPAQMASVNFGRR